jgi:ADP-ribosylglycohydrolase
MGGDSDTLACITGGIAEAYHGDIPAYMIDETQRVFPPIFTKILDVFRKHTFYSNNC